MSAWGRGAAALGLTLCVIPVSAAQATITVANTNDSGAGSLRQAILDAAPGETIVVPTNTYTLSAQLAIPKSLSIIGNGATGTIVRGGFGFRAFEVSGKTTSVTISGLTVRDGNVAAPGGIAQGGGIFNSEASLTLEGVVVRNNRVSADGGPAQFGGIAEGGGSTTQAGRFACLAAR